jgi:hypothetical protein
MKKYGGIVCGTVFAIGKGEVQGSGENGRNSGCRAVKAADGRKIGVETPEV